MKPTVLTLDSLDNRRQAFTAVLRGLTPTQRLDYLDFCCDFARLTNPLQPMLARVKCDRQKRRPLTEAAERKDEAADLQHANEIYVDVATLAHHWNVEWLPMVLELEHRACGREPTPASVAAFAWLSRLGDPSGAGSIRTPGRYGSAHPVLTGSSRT